MNGLTILILTGLIAFVLQPDTANLVEFHKGFERMPAHVPGEVYWDGVSLLRDCQAVRQKALDAPYRVRLIWERLRSNAAYTLNSAYQFTRHLQMSREIASLPNSPVPPVSPPSASER